MNSKWRAVQAVYERHNDFVLLLLLFVSFRMLALVAFRPGGNILDFSDFLWYRAYGELTRQGYFPYLNVWDGYPPLFSVVMLTLYRLSSQIPPWEHANLWYSLFLGGFFLLFETGNFILLYLLALQLYPGAGGPSATAIRTGWIYATLFVPVYTLTGWFESYPLFFFLLSLYLLLRQRPYLSAVFTGAGFMVKLLPILLLPVAFQLISRLKKQFTLNGIQVVIPFDARRILIYLTVLAVIVILIALPFYRMNPALILSPQHMATARPAWETAWALIDGNYNYGTLPLDQRNMAWTPGDRPATRIPWLPVTALFGLVYVLFYTRPLNWTLPRVSLAFTGFTLCLFLLWSKGYSPQFLVWPLFFIALLLPNLRGVVYAVILSIANIIEANFFFIIFPEERWLLATTILIRTFLLAVLAVEFLFLIWPQVVSPGLARLRAWGLAVFVVALLAGAIPAGWQLGQSYVAMRQRQSPFAATISRLQQEPVKGTLLLNDQTVYDWFYPYLRRDYSLAILDDYAPPGQSVYDRTTALLADLAARSDVLWIYDADAATTSPAEEALLAWLGDRPPAHIQDIDGGRLYLFILK